MKIESTEDIVRWIKKIEEKYPVANWKIGDVLYWPIIRNGVYLILVNSLLNTNHKNKKVLKLSKWQQLKMFINASISYCFYFRKLSKAHAIGFGAMSHRVNFKNIFWNRYLDPLFDKDNKCQNYIFEYSNISKNFYHEFYKKNRVRLLQNIFYLLNIKVVAFRNLKVIKSDYEMDQYHLFFEDLLNLNITNHELEKYSINNLIKYHYTFYVYAKFYKKLLIKLRPQKIYLLCYYTRTLYPLIHVANQLGINIIDIQHGGQGEDHLAYSNWNQWPIEKKYTCLPKKFWVWNADAKNLIQNSFDKNDITYHSVYIGGNPWIDYLKDIKMEEYNFLPNQIILYSLQPYGEFLEEKIVEIIKQCPDNFSWFLRMHPRQLHQKSELIAFLKKKEIFHLVNLDDANNIQLPFLLRNTVLHITKSSGSALEAELMGIKNLIMDKVGKEMYNKQIQENKNYYFIDDVKNDLLKFVYG